MAFHFEGNNILDGATLVARLDSDGGFTLTKAGRGKRLDIAAFVGSRNPMDPAATDHPADPALQALIDEAKGIAPQDSLLEEVKGDDCEAVGIDWAKAPALDPSAGDKTPAFVEWLQKNHPEEFARRYKNRKTHLSHV